MIIILFFSLYAVGDRQNILDRLKEHREDLEARRKAIQEKGKVREAEEDHARPEVQQAYQDLDILINGYAIQTLEKEALLIQHEDTIIRVTAENAVLRQRIQELEAALKDLEIDYPTPDNSLINHLQRQFEETNAQLAAATEEIKALEKDNQNLEQALSVMQHAKRMLEAMRYKEQGLVIQADQFKKETEALKVTNADLLSENEHLRTTNHTLIRNTAIQTRRVAELEKKMATEKEGYDYQIQQLERRKEDEICTSEKVYVDALKDLHAQIHALEEQVIHYVKTVSQAKEEASRYAEQVGKVNLENNTLRRELMASNEKLKQTEEWLTDSAKKEREELIERAQQEQRLWDEQKAQDLAELEYVYQMELDGTLAMQKKIFNVLARFFGERIKQNGSYKSLDANTPVILAAFHHQFPNILTVDQAKQLFELIKNHMKGRLTTIEPNRYDFATQLQQNRQVRQFSSPNQNSTPTRRQLSFSSSTTTTPINRVISGETDSLQQSPFKLLEVNTPTNRPNQPLLYTP